MNDVLLGFRQGLKRRYLIARLLLNMQNASRDSHDAVHTSSQCTACKFNTVERSDDIFND